MYTSGFSSSRLLSIEGLSNKSLQHFIFFFIFIFYIFYQVLQIQTQLGYCISLIVHFLLVVNFQCLMWRAMFQFMDTLKYKRLPLNFSTFRRIWRLLHNEKRWEQVRNNFKVGTSLGNQSAQLVWLVKQS